MADVGVVGDVLAAAVRIATPLLLAATGELVAERAGVINLGVEGAMLGGALAAALGASAGGPVAGLLAGAAVGLLFAALFAGVALGLGANQIITGTAITLAAVGLTGAIHRQAFGSAGAGLGIPTLTPLALPGLSAVPVLGPALFRQALPTYLALLAVPAVWWWLFRTRPGLALRAAGEDAARATTLGVAVRRQRVAATLFGGAMAGFGGATLVLAQVGTFAEKMTAGRGFVAIALVVLGRWQPVGVLLAALAFGGLTALQFAFQAMGLAVPYQLFLVLPYALTLLALAGVVGGVRAPAALGRT